MRFEIAESRLYGLVILSVHKDWLPDSDSEFTREKTITIRRLGILNSNCVNYYDVLKNNIKNIYNCRYYYMCKLFF